MAIRITKKRQRFLKGLLTALAMGLVCCLIGYFQLFHSLSQKSSDLLYRGQNSSYLSVTARKIVIIGIDDASLQEYGRISSWPRSLHASLIDTLSESGARIIAFDVLFSEASPDDAELAAAMQRAGNVILPYADTGESVPAGEGNTIKPLKVLEDSALATGYGNMAPDDDGVIRKLPVILPYGDQFEPSLALVTVAEYLRRPQVFDSTPQQNLLTIAGRDIPLQSWDMLINYTVNPSSGGFETVSFTDVLHGAFAPDTFKDKIVIIGVTALGFGDTYWTPLGQALGGVQIHAQAINTMLSGRFIRPASSLVMYLSIMLMAVICGLVTLRFRVLWSSLSTLLLGIIYCLAAFYLFDKGLLLDLFYPLLALVAVFIGTNLYNVTLARMEKGEITRTFGRYVSPPAARKILSALNEGSLILEGEECPVTVLFADARNFTGFCEKLRPDVVVGTLNRYFSIIIDSILKYDGMVNKFSGDSVMAVWNAPISCPEHALSAVRAAALAQEQIGALQVGTPDLLQMKFGIGINTGKAIIGNMGSKDRLEYSLVGDTVNIAARLSALAPGGGVWVGPETYEAVKHQYVMASLGPLALKGREKLIDAYELCLTEDKELGRLMSTPEELAKALV